MTQADDVRELVRTRYAAAAAGAGCCGPDDALGTICNSDESEVFGARLYRPDETADLSQQAVRASLGCGNPVAVADMRDGETVLDLGSGGGLDVLLSARRVGPMGFVYGLDMTDEMLALARANAGEAGVANVEFLKGEIEAIPLPDASVDVIISNCVINLSTDKPAVLAEMFRVLTTGGRIGISDVVAQDELTPAERAERGSYVGCIAGALSRSEYLQGLAAVGFTGAEVTFTHQVAPGMHGAIVRANKPAHSPSSWVPRSCTLPTAQQPLRLQQFAELFADAAISVGRVSPSTARLTLRPEPGVAARTAELASLETACCSFFTFTLVMTEGSVTLDISVPTTQISVLDALTGIQPGAR